MSMRVLRRDRLGGLLREYAKLALSDTAFGTHRSGPHRTLKQAAPLRPLPDGVPDLERLRIQRRDRAGGVIHEYRLMA
jgi:hypothetical protein